MAITANIMYPLPTMMGGNGVLPLKRWGILILKSSNYWRKDVFIHHMGTAREVSKCGVISDSYFPVYRLNTEIYGVNLLMVIVT